jgi:hypothetical protein
MHPVFGQGFPDRILMTSLTQSGALLFGFNGSGCGGWQVAFGAFSLGHGCMHLIIQDAPGIGPVGIVAGITPRVGHRIVLVLALKSRLIGFVAALTQGRYGLFE